MKRKRRHGRVLSKEDLERMRLKESEALWLYKGLIRERQQALLELLEERRPEQFVWLVIQLLDGARDRGFAPDPRFHPRLREKLDRVRDTGWPVDGLRVSRVGQMWEAPRLRIELPLDADLKDYRRAMEAYQEYFESLGTRNLLVAYLADEHGQGRTYRELAAELNEAIEAWGKGEPTKLDSLGLDAFLKRRGYTRENYEKKEQYDAERVQSIVRWYWKRQQDVEGQKSACNIIL